eukprot:scaffold5901_cov24-Tisochrysis_lutea.AAC.1
MGEQTHVLTVTGMMCGGCSGSLETIVKKMPGVISIKAEPQPVNKVTLVGDTSMSLDDVKAAIQKGGWTVEA